MNKRGIGLVWQAFLGLFFALLIGSLLFIFVARYGHGDLIQTQIIAKELCLAITAARSNSIIEVEHAKNIIIELKDSAIVVKSSERDPGYLYPCYPKEVYLTRKGNRTYFEIK